MGLLAGPSWVVPWLVVGLVVLLEIEPLARWPAGVEVALLESVLVARWPADGRMVLLGQM